MKNPVQFWLGLIGLLAFGLLIMAETWTLQSAPIVSQGSVAAFALLGVFMAGELILIGLGKDKGSFKNRVFDEKQELDKKRGDLFDFLNGEKFSLLPEFERRLLLEQIQVMDEYSMVLGSRILNFK